jgi:hypothetical protein
VSGQQRFVREMDGKGTAVGPPRLTAKIIGSAGLVSTVVILLTTWPVLFTNWFSPIDDHEYARLLGGDGSLPFWEIPDALLGTEVSQFGSTSRWRPIYYIVQTVETAIWGQLVWPRYLFRLSLVIAVASCQAAVFVAVIQWGRQVIMPRPSATKSYSTAWGTGGTAPAAALALGAFWFSGLYAWSDVAPRLGPSEQFAAAGLTLMILGSYGVARRRPRGWILITSGYGIAIFSKENFAVLFLGVILIAAWSSTWNARFLRAALLGVVTCLAFISVLLLALLPGILRDGDVYGRQVSLDGSLDQVGAVPWLAVTVTAAVVIFGLSMVIFRRRLAVQGRSLSLSWVLLICAFGLVIGLSEWITYGGSPSQPRYFLLSEEVVTWCIGVAVGLMFVSARTQGASGRSMGVMLRSGAVVLAVLLTASSIAFATITFARSWDNAARAREFRIEIRQVSEAATRVGAARIFATSSGEYETVASVAKYLSWLAPGADVTLDYNGGVESELGRTLARTARVGSIDWGVSPQESDRGVQVACIYLSQSSELQDPACALGAVIVLTCDAVGARPLSNWFRVGRSAGVCIAPSGSTAVLGH